MSRTKYSIIGWLLVTASWAFQMTQIHTYAIGDAHSDMITSVSFYNDGTKFVTGSKDNTAKIWSMADGSNLKTESFPDWVVHISLHPTDNRIFILCIDGSTRVLDPDSYTVLSDQPHPLGGVASFDYIRFIQSGDKYITGGYDDISGTNSLWIYDSATYTVVSTFSTTFSNYDEITILAVSRDETQLAAISANTVAPIKLELYDLSGPSVDKSFSDNSDGLIWTIFSPFSDTIYTTCNDRTLKFYSKNPYDSTYSQYLTYFTNDYGTPYCLNANIEGVLIFSAADNLVFLDVSSKQVSVISSLQDQEDVFVFDLSADNQHLISGMRNGEVTVWQIVSNAEGQDSGSRNNYFLLIIVASSVGGLILLLLAGLGVYHFCCRSNQVAGLPDKNQAGINQTTQENICVENDSYYKRKAKNKNNPAKKRADHHVNFEMTSGE